MFNLNPFELVTHNGFRIPGTNIERLPRGFFHLTHLLYGALGAIALLICGPTLTGIVLATVLGGGGALFSKLESIRWPSAKFYPSSQSWDTLDAVRDTTLAYIGAFLPLLIHTPLVLLLLLYACTIPDHA